MKFFKVVMDLKLDDKDTIIMTFQLTYNSLVCSISKSNHNNLLGINMSVMSKKDTYVRVCNTYNYYAPISEYNTYKYECDMAYYISSIYTLLESICSPLVIKYMSMIISCCVLPSRGIYNQHHRNHLTSCMIWC